MTFLSTFTHSLHCIFFSLTTHVHFLGWVQRGKLAATFRFTFHSVCRHRINITLKFFLSIFRGLWFAGLTQHVFCMRGESVELYSLTLLQRLLLRMRC